MDDNNIRELDMEQQDTDGIAKRATEYHKRIRHPLFLRRNIRSS